MTLYRRRCSHCKTMYETRRKTPNGTRGFCKPQCVQDFYRGTPEAKARSRKGAAARVRNLRQREAQRVLMELGPHATLIDAYWYGKRQEASKSYKRGLRMGFSQGYEQALTDSDRKCG